MLLNVTTHQLQSSGLVEAYLLGLMKEEELAEVAERIASDVDLKAYVHTLDTDIATHFMTHAVPPPPGIRGIIELRDAEQSLQKRNRGYSGSNQQTGYQDSTAKPNYIDVEVDTTHIRVHKYWRPAFIAVFVLSKIFLATGLYFYFKADSQAQEISRLKAEIHQSARK